jgi:hypothetical protein
VRKTLFLITVVGLLVGVLVSTALPASATITGGVEFSCSVNLPVWPTGNGGVVTCNGKATGFITGTTTTGTRYNGVINNDTLMATTVGYDEQCGPDGQVPVNGFANGTATISGIQTSGAYTGKSTASTAFLWTRNGATAIISLSQGVVKRANGTVLAKGNFGVAAAAFIPTSTSRPGTCTDPQPLTARIIGQALFPS